MKLKTWLPTACWGVLCFWIGILVARYYEVRPLREEIERLKANSFSIIQNSSGSGGANVVGGGNVVITTKDKP